jgi:prepilin-type N-terminal cleavage/methylation domain-containing protein
VGEKLHQRGHEKEAGMNRLSGTNAREDGFTLIELLVVIVILGILAAVAVFAVGGVTSKGQAASCQADVKSVEVASEAYFAKNGAYAADIPALVTAKLLREAPSTTNGYTVTYSSTDGSVNSTPTCSSLS